MPYFSEFFSYLNLPEPAEWTRGKLLSKTFFKNSNFVRKEDYTYYSWSPHLSNGDQEDYVQEISTNLISKSYLGYLYNPQLSSPVDFFENQPPLSKQYNFAGFNFCINYHYGAANYNFNVTYGPDYPNIFCVTSLTVPYFIHYTAFDKLKTKAITTRDDNGNNIVETENYYYDKTPGLHQLTRTESLNSSLQTVKTEVKFPIDFSSTAPYNTMLQRHILNAPLEQLTYKNTTLLKSNKTNYLFWSGNTLIKPSSIQQSIAGNSLETEATINDYDNKGNMLQVTGRDGVITSYLYGYNQQYPVAKIVNKSYNEAISQSGVVLSTLNNPFTIDADMRTELNKLRQLTNCYVSTYTYKNLIGLTSETDPNGRTTYYEYDAFNRLSLIRDQDNKIIKKICYNYAGQPEDCGVPSAWYNVQKSGAFTRNNCASGYIGTSATYTVAALTYSSTISQAAADQLAQNDVDANGQNYANTNGSCISNVCSFTAINTFTSPSSGFYNNGSVSGYLVFYSSTTLSPGTSYQVGFVSGACIPAGTRTFSRSSGGRTYNFTIQSNGLLTVELTSDSAPLSPYTTVSISHSYNL